MATFAHNTAFRALVRWLTRERPPPKVPLCDFERIRYEVKCGDVVLIEGRSRVADVIKHITQSRWSHAALFIGRLHDIEDPRTRARVKAFYDGQPDVQLIVESELGRGTVVRPLHVYDKDHLRICRPRDLIYRDAQRIIDYAVSRLGSDYDTRQIFDLFRLLFPWWFLPRRWRSSLFHRNIGHNTRTVCSTMIAESFSIIDYPILPLVQVEEDGELRLYRRNPKLFTPSDFDYSPYFDIIKYPFIDITRPHLRPHLLPFDSAEGELIRSDPKIRKS